MFEPCQICDDRSCHGCRVAAHKAELAAFASNLLCVALPDLEEPVAALLAAGVLSDDEAEVYRAADRELKRQFLRVCKPTEQTLLVNVVSELAEALEE